MIKGLDELTANLQKLAKIADTELTPGAAVLLESIRNNAPVNTGNLRDGYVIDGNSIVTDVPYAADVEYGTQRMPAQPHVRPAIDEHQDAIAKAIADDIAQQIAKVL